MVEMVIGLLLVSMIIMVAMSFMILQSRYGQTATSQRSAREVVALALNMIARDVRQAGYGLGDSINDFLGASPVPPIDSLNLALLPDPDDTHCFEQTWEDGSKHWCNDRLYIQYGMYIQNVFELQSEPVVPSTTAGGRRYYKPGGSEATWPFVGSGVDASADPVRASLKAPQVGGLIGYNFSAATVAARKRRLLLEIVDPTAATPSYNIKDPISETSTATQLHTYYAPAVVYSYRGAPDYEIRRNGVSLTAGRSDLRITGFCVQATFCDSTTVPCGSAVDIMLPQSSTNKRFETYPIRNLKTLIITLRYKVRQGQASTDPTMQWGAVPESKRTVVVAPRAIVMQAALTQDLVSP